MFHKLHLPSSAYNNLGAAGPVASNQKRRDIAQSRPLVLSTPDQAVGVGDPCLAPDRANVMCSVRFKNKVPWSSDGYANASMTEPLDGLRFAPRHCGKAGLRSGKARDSVWDPWCEKAVFRFGILSLESPGIGFGPLVWNSRVSIWDLKFGKSGIPFRTLGVEKQGFDPGPLT